MRKKKAIVSVIDSVNCRGFEVIFESSGSMYAIFNCKINPDGSSVAFEGVGGVVSSTTVRYGEMWRTENWGSLFDAVGRSLCDL
jgi:hypothetical protein